MRLFIQGIWLFPNWESWQRSTNVRQGFIMREMYATPTVQSSSFGKLLNFKKSIKTIHTQLNCVRHQGSSTQIQGGMRWYLQWMKLQNIYLIKKEVSWSLPWIKTYHQILKRLLTGKSEFNITNIRATRLKWNIFV